MEMCHQKGSKESVSGLVDSTGRNGVLDESLPVAMDDTLPLSLDEDLGGKGCYSYWDMIVNQSVCNYFKKKKNALEINRNKTNQTNKTKNTQQNLISLSVKLGRQSLVFIQNFYDVKGTVDIIF